MSAAGTIGSAALAVKSFPAVKHEIGYYMAKYQCKTQSAIPTDEGATTATAKSAGGRLGNSATRQQNKAIGDYLQQKGWTVTGGGGQVKEEYLPPLSGKGRAGSNYIDITATKTTSHGEVTIRINTVDTYASGLPTVREQAAADLINQKIGSDPSIILIPKGTGLGNLPELLRGFD